MELEKTYTINNLAKIAGISTRTLRYYDQIGLLEPASRKSNNYREYSRTQILILQQILFYKEIGLDLHSIKAIITDPAFDILKSLDNHKRTILTQIKRKEKLLSTLDKTILNIKENIMLNDEDLYEGLTKDEIREIKAEASAKYGHQRVAESHRRLRKLSKEELEKIKVEGGRITTEIAGLMDTKSHDSQEVQKLIQQHYDHLRNFYEPNLEIYAGLAELYIQDSRFTEFYEKCKPGLAKFLSKAMKSFCQDQKSV